jgi:hypothetical protein
LIRIQLNYLEKKVYNTISYIGVERVAECITESGFVYHHSLETRDINLK